MTVATTVRELPARTLRHLLLALSRRRVLGRVATRVPLTRPMVGRFVAGESLDDAILALGRLRAAGFRTTVDVLGESVVRAEQADVAVDAYRATIGALADRGLDRNVSLKLTQMGLDLDEARCRANVERVFRDAAETDTFVRIDMEDHTKTEATLAIWRDLRSINPSSGVVIQAALKRSPSDVETLIAERARVRLCKGAYSEPPSVAWQERADVDRAYAALMERLLTEGEYPAIATHDERMHRRAVEIARGSGIGPERFEFQMLYGVRRDLQQRLVRDGWTVRIYTPYGHEWYAYFMRRLAERPSNVGFVVRSILSEGRGRGIEKPPEAPAA
jgi:proline dehydrogenase